MGALLRAALTWGPGMKEPPSNLLKQEHRETGSQEPGSPAPELELPVTPHARLYHHVLLP